jgi:hypothetical protein
VKFSIRVQADNTKVRRGENHMKMTKEKANKFAKEAIEHSKKYGIPLKKKKKK